MDKSEVHPDAKALAEEVDRLYVQGANDRVFAEQIRVFTREGAVHLANQEKTAEAAGNPAWPADDSLAAKFALLAALHDRCLPGRPRILPPPMDDWKKAVRSRDLGVRALVAACVWAEGAARNEGKERRNMLGEYLSQVRRHLAALAGAEPPPAMNGPAGLARELINVCDRILALGRGRGSTKTVEMCPYRQWEPTGEELDELARRAAQLVGALDADYPTRDFYWRDIPRPLADLYPEAAGIPQREFEQARDRVRMLNPGMTEAEVERAAAPVRALAAARSIEPRTKPQWPGVLTNLDGVLWFFRPPNLLERFEDRFEELKNWARKMAQPDQAAAPGRPARKKGYAMSNDSTRKAAALRKVAEALRAWGKLGGAKSPETCDAARNALDLATRHLDIIMAASNAYGRCRPTGQALEWLQEMAAARGHTDLGKYWGRWSWFTQPHLCGSPVPVRVSDDLERWADELEKAETVPAPRHEGADVPESDGKTAARPRKPNLAETFILAVFQALPDTEKRQYQKGAAIYALVKAQHPTFDRALRTFEGYLTALAKSGTIESKTGKSGQKGGGYRLPQK